MLGYVSLPDSLCLQQHRVTFLSYEAVLRSAAASFSGMHACRIGGTCVSRIFKLVHNISTAYFSVQKSITTLSHPKCIMLTQLIHLIESLQPLQAPKSPNPGEEGVRYKREIVLS